MTEFWESAFTEKQLMWGDRPSASAIHASDYFAQGGIHDVLIPGIGYGRNAAAFLDRGMAVTGIEISDTAIALARSRLGLQIPIHHGPVENMPYDRNEFDGIFCYGLVYLLDARQRSRLIDNCYRQLRPGGQMIFTVVSKKAPMYGQGKKLGDDCYERLPGLPMFFYDAASIEREFGPYGLSEYSDIEEPGPNGGRSIPFINVCCKKS